jgi:hypothetical protein
MGLYGSRRGLGSQPISFHWLHERTKANQLEAGEEWLGLVLLRADMCKYRNMGERRLCHSSGGYLLASNCGDPGSIPDQVTSDLW